MFDSEISRILLAVILGVAFWTVLIVMAVKFVFGPIFAGNRGSWSKLKERYGVEETPAPDQVFGSETVQVGLVRAKNCAIVGVSPRGLALKVPWHSPILIPWTEIHVAGAQTVSWRGAYRLEIGEPTVASIVLFSNVFGAMRPYLRDPRQVPIPPLMPIANV